MSSTLTPDQWQQVSPYLDEVLEIPPEQRTAWLMDLAKKDAPLASLVRVLLDEQEQLRQEGFLERSVLRGDAGLAGQKIGAYTLVSQLGEGGMGSVWLAQRSDGRFERQAAVKFVRLALTSRATQERFKREGSILGRLAHPHIAELLDAGISTDGSPYLILEYVDGEPIDHYCDEHKLDVDARITLFLDVLGAVAEAHANLIVHRDLKPSNVLVRNDGQTKLLDFGIAKLLAAEDSASSTVLTLEGGGALTPRFAAPEQVTGGNVTTATDVYALGVLLYLLLTGQHPAGTDVQSPAELLKAIVEVEAPRASATVLSPSDVAEKRSATVDKLRRQLTGDLDTILSKALKKNPQERYVSVTAFADDLRRYLKHEAISVRPDTFAYRTAKFVRRNVTVVAIAAAAIALVIGSLTTGLLLANRERKIAERRFAQVRQLANKFIALDNEIRGLPGATKIRMELVSDAQQYLTSLGNDVHGDKDLALEIAYAYVRVAHAQGDPTSPNLGQFDEAEASLNKASTFVEPILTKDPNNQRALFIATTIAHDRMILADNGGDREAVLRDAPVTAALVERFMSTHPVEFHDLYSMRYFYSNVANVYLNARHFDEVIQYCQRALDIAVPGPRANDLRGNAFAILGYARWQSGDLDGALKTTLDSIELKKAEAANGHASLLINLAGGYDLEGMVLDRMDAEPSLGRGREALTNFQKAVDIAEDLARNDPLDYLGRHCIAVFGLEMGNIVRHTDPPKALLLYDHALERIREAKANPSSQRDEAELLVGSSYPLRWTGHEAEAKQRIEKAFDLLQEAKRYSADKVEPMSETYDVLRAQADDYAQTGESAKAVEAYQQLLDKLMAWKPDLQGDLRDATCISRTETALADLLRRTGRNQEADRLLAQRTDLWNRWNDRLPNAQFLLRQSLSQITLRAASPVRHKQ
jgi:serine/threonine protein kinase/tetratricopeptide (TPR) repeat protein